MLGADYKIERKANRALKRWAFTSTRKRMSTIIPSNSKHGGFRLLCKGAAEQVIQLCSFFLNEDGKLARLSDVAKQGSQYYINS